MRQKIELQKQLDKKTFEDGYKEFILNCKVKGLSQYTIKYYDNVVRIWSNLYDPEKQLISDINMSTVDSFVMFLKTKTNENDITVNTNLRGVRAILYYFMKLGYMKEFHISKVKADKEIIETYTDEEIGILLKKPNLKKCTFTEYSDWVIINFLLGTGCRAMTLTNIKIQDLDFENDLIIYTHCKNRKQQLVPMSNSLKKVLQEYLQYRQGKPEDYLFVNAYGQKLIPNRISVNLANYNKRHGVMKTGVHRWRHTFAKKWIMANGNVFKLQKILGHSSLDIVKNYVNMFSTDLQQDFNEFNPLEQIKDKTHMKMKK